MCIDVCYVLKRREIGSETKKSSICIRFFYKKKIYKKMRLRWSKS